MNLNDFIALQLHAPKNRVPAYLTLPSDIQSTIKKTKASSESQALEMGHCLTWHAQLGKLTLDMPGFTGKFDSVDMNLPINKTKPDYIGNYHNHPYERRYGVDYALGPSSGDWHGWNSHFPTHKNLSVNIVTSGKLVFVVIFLTKPTAELIQTKHDSVLFSEAKNEYIYADEQRNMAYSNAIEKHAWQAENRLYQQIKTIDHTDVPKLHEQDVLTMNTAFAADNKGVAIYVGTLADTVCKLEIFAQHRELSFLDSLQSAHQSACYSCGAKRTHDNHSYFAKWHKCPGCKAIFCPSHGKALPGNHLLSRERNCAACNTRTHLF